MNLKTITEDNPMIFNEGQEVAVMGPGAVDKRQFMFVRYITQPEIGEFVRVPMIRDGIQQADESGPLFKDKWRPGPFAWVSTVGLKIVTKQGEIVEHEPYAEWAIVQPFPAGPFTSAKIVPVEFIQDVEAARLEAENKAAEVVSQIGKSRRGKKSE